MMIKKFSIYLLLLICCIKFEVHSGTDDLHGGGDTQARRWPFPWWRRPPLWPTPPHRHRKQPPEPPHSPPPRPAFQPPPSPPLPLPPGRDPVNCSTALIYIDGCVGDLITSFFEENVSVGPACCLAISGLSDDCFQQAFTQFKSPDFARRIRAFCAQPH